MTGRSFRARAGAAALGLAMALGGSALGADEGGAASSGHGAHAGHGAAPPGSFRGDMDEAMGRMMADMHAPGYSGDADVDFLAMMIPHHAGAVEMARLVLRYGRDPQTRMLAQEIIAGQTTEIEGMRRRLEALRHRGGAAEFPALGGTRGP